MKKVPWWNINLNSQKLTQSSKQCIHSKSFSMGNQLTFTGSGELDNGLTVSLSFILDQGDDKGKTTAADDNAGAPFDSHSVTISSEGAIGFWCAIVFLSIN